jgi:hypothetical protein
MPASTYVRPTVWVPPAHVVDRMMEAGSPAFGARWRVKEVTLVD